MSTSSAAFRGQVPVGRDPKSEAAVLAGYLKRIAVSRDEEAFQALFAAFGPRVKALLLRQGADMDTAEDIAQETLLTVWRKAHLFAEDRGSASTWIFTIARNLRIDRLRRRQPWQELTDDTPEEVSDDPLPDEAVAQRQESARIKEILATLPQEQESVIRLSYVEGLSHSEIADRLDVPLGTVKSRMRLAYQKVRDAIEDEL